MRGTRFAGAAFGLCALAGLLSGCSEYGFPTAVFLEGGTPKVALKACKDLRGIKKIAIRKGRYGDKRLPEVWVARLVPQSTDPLFEIPLRGAVPGYTITKREEFRANTIYTPEIDDVSGRVAGGPAFRFSDLEEGRVRAFDTGTGDRRVFSLRNWRLTKEDCPEIRKSEAMEFGSFGLLMLIPVTITAAAFALEFRRRRRQRLTSSQ